MIGSDIDLDDVLEERRKREFDEKESAKNAKLLREQEERNRRARTPIDVGNGRMWRG